MLEKNKDKNAIRPRLVLLVWLLGSLAFVGCVQDAEKASGTVGENLDSDFRVVAVSYPLQYLTGRIAGDLVAVDCPVPLGVEDPSQWKPSREAVLAMQSADLVIANGVGADYAKWLPKVSLPGSKLCRTATKGLSISDYIAVEDVSMVHSHGPEGEHSHPTMVSRTWLAVSAGSSASGNATTPLPRFCNRIGVAAISISRRPSPARISSG